MSVILPTLLAVPFSSLYYLGFGKRGLYEKRHWAASMSDTDSSIIVLAKGGPRSGADGASMNMSLRKGLKSEQQQNTTAAL